MKRLLCKLGIHVYKTVNAYRPLVKYVYNKRICKRCGKSIDKVGIDWYEYNKDVQSKGDYNDNNER